MTCEAHNKEINSQYAELLVRPLYFAFLDRIAIELRQQYSTAGSPDFATCVKQAARGKFFTS